jgi:hypothetical protein
MGYDALERRKKETFVDILFFGRKLKTGIDVG